MKTYNLPVDVQYKYLDCETTSKEDMTVCDNCQAFIVNVCWIQSERGKYKVGPDCVETLTSMNPDEKREAKRKLRRLLSVERKFRNVLKEGRNLLIEKGEHLTWFHDSGVSNWVFWLARASNDTMQPFIKKWEPRCKPYVQPIREVA